MNLPQAEWLSRKLSYIRKHAMNREGSTNLVNTYKIISVIMEDGVNLTAECHENETIEWEGLSSVKIWNVRGKETIPTGNACGGEIGVESKI